MKKLYSFYLDNNHIEIFKGIAEAEGKSMAGLLSEILYQYLESKNIQNLQPLETKPRTAITLKIKYKIWQDLKKIGIDKTVEKYRTTYQVVEKISNDGNPAYIKFEKEFGDPIKNSDVYEQWFKKHFE